jgi:hypothetical protein
MVRDESALLNMLAGAKGVFAKMDILAILPTISIHSVAYCKMICLVSGTFFHLDMTLIAAVNPTLLSIVNDLGV